MKSDEVGAGAQPLNNNQARVINGYQHLGSGFSSDQAISPGDFLESENGQFKLYFQNTDGNLVLRDQDQNADWASGTQGKNAQVLKFQDNGNLVLLGANSEVLWESGTEGTAADRVVLSNDGQLLLYAGDRLVWSNEAGLDAAQQVSTATAVSPGVDLTQGHVTVGGVNRTDGVIAVGSSTQPGDFEVVAIGGSSVAGGEGEPIDAELMLEQGFTLVGVQGQWDRKVEIWIREATDQEDILITGAGYDVAWSVTTFSQAHYDFDIAALPGQVLTVDDNHEGSRDASIPLPKTNNNEFSFGAIFFDDTVKTDNVDNGHVLFSTHGFGDGDGFAVVMYDHSKSNSFQSNITDLDRNYGQNGAEQYVGVFFGA